MLNRVYCLVLLCCLATAAIAEQAVLIARGEGNYPPLETLQDGVYAGLHIDITLAVAKRLGVKVEYLDLPWQRAINAVKEGEVDAITYLGYTRERAEFVHYFPGNVLSTTTTVFAVLNKRKQQIHFDGNLATMKDYVIGVQHGYSYGELVDGASFLNKDAVYSENDVEDMLVKGRHDLSIISYQELLGFKQRGLMKDITYLDPPISWESQYLAFSSHKKNDQRALAKRFSDEAQRFRQTDEYRNLVKRYNYYEYEK